MTKERQEKKKISWSKMKPASNACIQTHGQGCGPPPFFPQASPLEFFPYPSVMRVYTIFKFAKGSSSCEK